MIKHKVIHVCLAFLVVSASLGCNTPPAASPISDPNQITSEQPLTIRTTESPTSGDSREPEFTATQDGRGILSWIEKTGDKRYALRTAALDQNGWSEARTVSEGDNWFVNWADFRQ